MAVLYIKQGAVKLPKVLMKSTHCPHRLPQQTCIGCRTAQTSNKVGDFISPLKPSFKLKF